MTKGFEGAPAPTITVASSGGKAARAGVCGAGAGTLGSNKPAGSSGMRASGAGAVVGHPVSAGGTGARDGAGDAFSLAPQLLQNLAASRFSVLQSAHTTAICCSYDLFVTRPRFPMPGTAALERGCFR